MRIVSLLVALVFAHSTRGLAQSLPSPTGTFETGVATFDWTDTLRKALEYSNPKAERNENDPGRVSSGRCTVCLFLFRTSPLFHKRFFEIL